MTSHQLLVAFVMSRFLERKSMQGFIHFMFLMHYVLTTGKVAVDNWGDAFAFIALYQKKVSKSLLLPFHIGSVAIILCPTELSLSLHSGFLKTNHFITKPPRFLWEVSLWHLPEKLLSHTFVSRIGWADMATSLLLTRALVNCTPKTGSSRPSGSCRGLGGSRKPGCSVLSSSHEHCRRATWRLDLLSSEHSLSRQ